MEYFYPFYLPRERPMDRRFRSSRLADQHFGLGLTPDDFLTAIITLPQSNNNYINNYQLRPWRNMQQANDEVGSTIKKEKDKFQINIDVQHFAPDEISVKTADRFLIIEGHHGEIEDEHGFVTRSFSRRYPLPEGVDSESVVSKLSSDGVLTIAAPMKPLPKASNERIIPVVQTGPVKKVESDIKKEDAEQV